MPFSALPKPVPSSASPSGIISAPGWAAPIAAPSPTSRNSSARRSRAVNRPDFCPYYNQLIQVLDVKDLWAASIEQKIVCTRRRFDTDRAEKFGYGPKRSAIIHVVVYQLLFPLIIVVLRPPRPPHNAVVSRRILGFPRAANATADVLQSVGVGWKIEMRIN